MSDYFYSVDMIIRRSYSMFYNYVDEPLFELYCNGGPLIHPLSDENNQ